MGIFEKNPMTYARAIDINLYIRADFKPLEDRVRDIVTIEDQTANIMTGRQNESCRRLAEALRRARNPDRKRFGRFSGERSLAAAVKDVTDEPLMAAFRDANKKAAAALRDYAAWLTKEKLPKATAEFALGATKYQQMLANTELVDLPPDKILAIGLQRLKEEQQVFANACEDHRSEEDSRSTFSRKSRTSTPSRVS
jgi:hypothetical protein